MKTKKIHEVILEAYQEKPTTKFNKVLWWTLWVGDPTKFNKDLWWTLWVGDPRNFHNSVFVKDCYLNLNFLKLLQSVLLKNERKSSQKRCKQSNNFLAKQETDEKH